MRTLASYDWFTVILNNLLKQKPNQTGNICKNMQQVRRDSLSTYQSYIYIDFRCYLAHGEGEATIVEMGGVTGG